MILKAQALNEELESSDDEATWLQEISSSPTQLSSLRCIMEGFNTVKSNHIKSTQHRFFSLRSVKVIVAPQGFHALADSSASEAEAGKGKV